MSPRLSRLQALLLGLAVVAALALGGWAVTRLGQQQGLFAETFTVTAGFPAINGVTPGTPVRVRGIDAGIVAGIDLPTAERPADQVWLRLRLDRKYQHLLFSDATASIESEGMIGGKIVALNPGANAASPLGDGAVIGSRSPTELNDVLQQATAVLKEVRDSNGTLGQLLKNDTAYKEMVELLRESRGLMKKSTEAVSSVQETVTAVKQDAEAIKKLPIVRSYVVDSAGILVRPDCLRFRQVIPTAELFEPQRSVLTENGQQKMNEIAGWLAENRYKKSEVVVVAFADPNTDLTSDFTRKLTEMQAEAALKYLTDRGKAHKTGWWFWSTRKTTALGHGTAPTPVPEPTPLPPGRLEIIVYVPE